MQRHLRCRDGQTTVIFFFRYYVFVKGCKEVAEQIELAANLRVNAIYYALVFGKPDFKAIADLRDKTQKSLELAVNVNSVAFFQVEFVVII